MRGGPGQASRATLLSAGGCFVAKCRRVSGWPMCHQKKHCPSISHLLLLMPEKQELLGPPNPARQSLRSSDWPGLETASQKRGSLFAGSLLTAGPGHPGLLPHPWEQDSHIAETEADGHPEMGAQHKTSSDFPNTARVWPNRVEPASPVPLAGTGPRDSCQKDCAGFHDDGR